MNRCARIVMAIIITVAMFSLVGCGSKKENEKEKSLVYTVTFVQDGQEDIIKQVESGATLSDIPVPVSKTGYTISWDRTIFENVTGDIIVNAVETAKSYTVHFDLGELAEDRYASIPSATQTVVYDALYSLYVPECYGYDFIKWEECESGNEFIDGVWANDKDVFLTAVWNINHLNLLFSESPLNATQSDLKVVLPEEYKEPIRVAFGETIKCGLPEGKPFNKDDYKFDRWVVYIDGKEITLNDETVFNKSDFSGLQGGEIIVYPVLKSLWLGPF